MSAQSSDSVVERISRVIRASRKLAGKSQAELATALDVSEMTIRRYERGQSTVPLVHGLVLRKELDITQMTDFFESGYIDNLSIAKPNNYEQSTFAIPPQYKKYARSSVRVAMPFFYFFEKHYGKDKLDDFLRWKKVDRDLLYVLDHSVSHQFILDIAAVMIRDGVLNSETLAELADFAARPIMHGGLHPKYSQFARDPIKMLASFISNVRTYETNMAYSLDEIVKNRMVFSVSPNPVMRHFDYESQSFGDFFTEYRSRFISAFCHNTVEVKVIQSQLKGTGRCTYQVTKK